MMEQNPIILNVDDNEVSRYATTLTLKRAGFGIREAASGAEALYKALERPDLIILDVNLPDINGFEVCRRIRANKQTSQIPVLHLTSTFPDDIHRIEGLEAGADNYLIQPIQPAVLVATVRAMLRAHEAEIRLESAVREWESIFDAVGEAMCVVNERGTLLRCNRAFTELFGRKRSGRRKMLGSRISTLVPQVARILSEQPSPAVPADVGIGDRWFRFAIHPFIQGAGLSGNRILVLTDITPRKHMEAASEEAQRMQTELLHELQQSRDELETRVRERTSVMDESNRALRISRERLRALSAHLQTVREEERAAVARDLHDQLGGSLTRIKWDLDWISRQLPKDSVEMRKRTEEMLLAIDSTIDDIKQIVSALRPGLLDDFGFLASVEWQLEDFRAKSGINTKLDCDSNVPDIPDLKREKAIALFRILQETLTNVLRHAQASAVEVKIARDENALQMQIRDNGVGIGDEQMSNTASLGLLGMQERAAAIGGELSISRPPGGGTVVSVSVPIP